MKPKFFPLFQEATTELASAGGSSVSAPAAAESVPEATAEPVTEPTAAAATEEEPAPAPTFLQTVLASVKDKGHLAAENSGLRERLATLTTTTEQQAAEIATLREQVVTLTEERSQIQAALTAAQESATAVEQQVAAEVASLGFPAAALPESVHAGETREEILAQLDRETDNAKRWELAKKLNELG